MHKDKSTNVLLHLDPETYESLEHFGKEEHVSVHHSAMNLLMQGFGLWRKGKLDIEVTEKAQSYYSRSRGARGARAHFSHKKVRQLSPK